MSTGWAPVDVLDPHREEHWLASETTLSRQLGHPIRDPIRLFHLDAIGVDFTTLQARVAPTFAQLPWDEYDAKRERVELLRRAFPSAGTMLDAFLREYYADLADLSRISHLVDGLDDPDRATFDAVTPSRRRAVARFEVRRSAQHPFGWQVERQPDAPFRQTADHDRDVRTLERHFAASPESLTETAEYQAVIARVAAMADAACDGTLSRMQITCHQMGLVARPDDAVSNTPEGVHQDGSDFIVSALVVERRGVEGGESIVYGPDKRTEYLRHCLQEGEGIFQADLGSALWHWATPVRLSDSAMGTEGVRNILGYDVHLG